MKWLLFLFPLLLHAQVNLRDPAFIAAAAGGSAGPTSIPPVLGFTMWIDPSDLTTVYTNYTGTTNGTVSDIIRRVADKSVSGTNFIVADGEGNVGFLATNLCTTALAMFRSAYFITSNLTTLGISSGNDLTVFCIMRGSNTIGGSFNTLWEYGGNASHYFAYRKNNAAFQMTIVDASTGTPSLVGDTCTNGFVYAMCAQISTNTLRQWTGLHQVTPDTTYGPTAINTTSKKMGLGHLWGFGGNIWDGAWGEFIVYNRFLTTLEVTNVQNYLITKWGAKTTN